MREIKSIKHVHIVGSSLYGWQCFGKNQYIYDIAVSSKYLNPDEPPNEIGSFVMNNKGEIAEITFYKINKEEKFKAWRWMDSKFLDSYVAECSARGVNPKLFIDDVEFKDVSKEKILTLIDNYAKKIHDKLKESNKTVDNLEEKTEDVEIYLDDNEFSSLARQAHEKDITLNQHINNILRDEMKRIEENKSINNRVGDEGELQNLTLKSKKTKKFK